MTSGALITLFLFGGLGFLLTSFTIWELIQLYRNRKGNKTSLTASQYIIKRIKDGSKAWLFTAIAFPLFLIAVGVWLTLHWEGWCYWQGWLCNLSRSV